MNTTALPPRIENGYLPPICPPRPKQASHAFHSLSHSLLFSRFVIGFDRGDESMYVACWSRRPTRSMFVLSLTGE